MKRPTTTKGFPETSKRLAECDITRWRHIVSSTTPHPLPNRASATTLRQVIPSLKRCSEVETYRFHLHHPKERAKQTSTDCQSNQYWSYHRPVLVYLVTSTPLYIPTLTDYISRPYTAPSKVALSDCPAKGITTPSPREIGGDYPGYLSSTLT